MESFGEYLKSLREEKGISLEDISDRTKIALTNLELLERDRFDLLPPRVFVKGFIRSYVQELGLNAEEAVARFEDFTKEGEVPDYENEEHPLFQEKPRSRAMLGGKIFTVTLTVAGVVSLIILLLTGATRLFFNGSGNDVIVPSVTTSQSPDENSHDGTSANMGRRSSETFTEPPPAQAGKKILEIKAIDHTWLRVQPDIGPPQEVNMAPGDIQRFWAKKSFFLQTGNAGGIRLRYDGQELPALGKPNQTLALPIP